MGKKQKQQQKLCMVKNAFCPHNYCDIYIGMCDKLREIVNY